MAIVFIQNLSGREAEYGKYNDSRRRRSWWVKTDTRYSDEGQLLADGIGAGVFPIPYVSSHPNDILFVCKRLRSKQEMKAPLFWTVDADYDTVPFTQDEEEPNPLDRRAKISWSTVKYQKAVEKDRNDDAILNSAGDYFDPPPLKDISRWTATVTKNLEIVPLDILSYADAINNASWDIDGVTIPENVAKIMGISISETKMEGDTEYRVLQYTVEFDDVDMWKGKYLNQGFYYYDMADNERKRCQVNKKDSVSPQLLDEDGDQLDDPSPATATFEEYDIYTEMDFSVLPVT